MENKPKAYFIQKLHNRDENCWSVIDENGAIINLNGLSMRLTREQAEHIAAEKNKEARIEDPSDDFMIGLIEKKDNNY